VNDLSESAGRFSGNGFAQFAVGAVGMFILLSAGVPLLLWFLRLFGVFTIVRERRCQVFVLFGKVIGVLDEPGLHFLWSRLGWQALIVRFLGRVETVDLRLYQEYLRSQAVNSEEGAPMGIGVWYEMIVSDPVAYLFKNADPRGSLAANVSNATVRCLSNLKLGDMLVNRHFMSQTVREEVSPKSQEWGYRLGSIYIRKVHFRDAGMIRQIEEKVVNRLRQVTSAIKQDGANQVNIITSTAERQAAVEFAKAAAMRPRIVGSALREISEDPEISRALFDVLEVQNLLKGEAEIVLLPGQTSLMGQLVAVGDIPSAKYQPPPLQ
jgi:regulator of protease activity HflC (stomatin/prohibitin superfamily)